MQVYSKHTGLFTAFLEVTMIMLVFPYLIHFMDNTLDLKGLGLMFFILFAVHFYFYKFYDDSRTLILFGLSTSMGVPFTVLLNINDFVALLKRSGDISHILYCHYIATTFCIGIGIYLFYKLISHVYGGNSPENWKY